MSSCLGSIDEVKELQEDLKVSFFITFPHPFFPPFHFFHPILSTPGPSLELELILAGGLGSISLQKKAQNESFFFSIVSTSSLFSLSLFFPPPPFSFSLSLSLFS